MHEEGSWNFKEEKARLRRTTVARRREGCSKEDANGRQHATHPAGQNATAPDKDQGHNDGSNVTGQKRGFGRDSGQQWLQQMHVWHNACISGHDGATTTRVQSWAAPPWPKHSNHRHGKSEEKKERGKGGKKGNKHIGKELKEEKTGTNILKRLTKNTASSRAWNGGRNQT